MKVLITGGLGYLGPVIAREFKAKSNSARITTFDTGFFRDVAIESDAFSGFDEIYYRDVRTLTVKDLKGFDVVVHLAAVSNDPMGSSFEEMTYSVNYHSTVQLATFAKMAGVRTFVFASSCSVYGAAGETARTEASPMAPLTAYAKSKTLSDHALASLAGDGLSIVSLRFATACGWAPNFRTDLVLNDFVVSALTTGKITVLSDGSPWRPLVHVRDIARGVVWAAGQEHGRHEIYNVGFDEWTMTIAELAEKVSAVLGTKYEIVGKPGGDLRSYRVSFAKFAADSGIVTPVVNFREAVEQIADNVRKHPERFIDFRNGNTIRLNVLRQAVQPTA